MLDPGLMPSPITKNGVLPEWLFLGHFKKATE
jgi:hypothetical protein